MNHVCLSHVFYFTDFTLVALSPPTRSLQTWAHTCTCHMVSYGWLLGFSVVSWIEQAVTQYCQDNTANQLLTVFFDMTGIVWERLCWSYPFIDIIEIASMWPWNCIHDVTLKLHSWCDIFHSMSENYIFLYNDLKY